MKKNYLSKEGYEKLEKELRELKTEGRKKLLKKFQKPDRKAI